MKLPDKPSELLMIAMEDLEWVESQPKKYKFVMSNWYERRNWFCEVCHAGSVIARRGGSSLRETVLPNFFDEDSRRKLLAIDDIRMGYIEEFFKELGIPLPKDIHPHADNFSQRLFILSDSKDLIEFQDYKNWIVSFIGILQAEGL